MGGVSAVCELFSAVDDHSEKASHPEPDSPDDRPSAGATGSAMKSAVRPYPEQYVSPWTMKDGTAVVIRPIRPDDEPLMVKFHESLSERSVFSRYFQIAKLSRRIAHERLVRICFADYDHEIALVAEAKIPPAMKPAILGVGRLSKSEPGDKAELAVIVSDAYQGRGLGKELLRRLILVAREEGVRSLHGYLLQGNTEMRALIERLGFRTSVTDDVSVLRSQLDFQDMDPQKKQ
jgi:acetyltransferase